MKTAIALTLATLTIISAIATALPLRAPAWAGEANYPGSEQWKLYGSIEPERFRAIGLEIVETLKPTAAEGKLQDDVINLFIRELVKKLEAEAISKNGSVAPHDLPPFLSRHMTNVGDSTMETLGIDEETRQETVKRFPELLPLYTEQQALENANADRRRQAETERQEKAAAEARKPENRLVKTYEFYAKVQFCNQVRQGYAMVFVTDVEMQRARVATKTIEKDLLTEEPSLNTDKAWQQALANVQGWRAFRETCQGSYMALLRLSPIDMYPIQKP
jgi:hypothetical protein